MEYQLRHLISDSNSKANLRLIKKEDQFFVQKDFLSDLERAMLNTKKQKDFGVIPIDRRHSVFSVEIIETLSSSNVFSIRMPFVDGVPIQHLLSFGRAGDIHLFLSLLEQFLYGQIEKSESQSISLSLFLDKLEHIRDKTRDGALKEIISLCYLNLQFWPHELSFPIGPCHGDLTLSNMVFTSDNNIVLFDFLAVFLESPLQDVAKLLIDIEYGWSVRTYSDMHTTRLRVIDKYCSQHLFSDLHTAYHDQIRLLKLFNFLRLLPYIEDRISLDWALHKAKSISSFSVY